MTRYWQTHARKYRLAAAALWVGAILTFSFAVQAQGPAQAVPYVNNPVGALTGPPSAYQSALVSQPDPLALDNNTNLLITGHVDGAKHFRASLPYASAQDFQAPLASSYLDSFLRISQDPGSAWPSPGVYTPYYPSSRTVTRTLPGGHDILSPASLKRDSGPATDTAIDDKMDFPLLPLTSVAVPMSLFHPLSNIGYVGDLLSLDQGADDLTADGPAADAGHGNLLSQSTLVRLLTQDRATDTRTTQQQAHIPSGMEMGSSDSTTTFDASFPVQPDLMDPSLLTEQLDSQEVDLRVTPFQLIARFQTQEQLNPPGFSLTDPREPADGEAVSTDIDTTNPTPESASEAVLPAGPSAAVPGTLAAYGWSRYTRFMKDAESYLKEGRFSEAISAYKLAAIHNPQDPLAAAGRSHALFAQGEFSSSALFLTRALERRPDYAAFLIDLSALMGGQEEVHQRIQELEKHLAYSGAFDLQCLLAYVSYQIGDVSRAQELIAAAQKKQPENQAVLTLQRVIQKSL